MSSLPAASELLESAVTALNGKTRPGQVTMAQAIDDAIGAKEHAVVQAGTGTGKSMAYLVPALRHAVASDMPVVVSTATLALQNQLVSNDIPVAVSALTSQLGRKPKAVVVKGRSNYVCKQKLAGGYPEEPDGLFDLPPLPGTVITTSRSTDLSAQVRRVREWAESTTTGDRDHMDRGVNNTAWRQVSVSARECMGSKCPMVTECFVERSRAEAQNADVIVTNHALLAQDAFGGHGLLPEHEVLIVDEAHELSDRVTSVVSASLTVESLKQMLKRSAAVQGQSPTLTDAVDTVVAELGSVANGRLIKGIPDPLRAHLMLLSTETKSAHSACGANSSQDSAQESAERIAARAALSEVVEVCDRLVAGSEHDVIWASRDYRAEPGSPAGLHVAPLWVSGLLASALFEDRTVVLTSATLTSGGRFDTVLSQWGLNAEQHTFRTVDVGSPFVYQKQGILYIARHLPPPAQGGPHRDALAEIGALVNAAGGGALGLFSSRAAAERAAEQVRNEVDFPVLCQGDAPMPDLVKDFAAEESACLFGTLTLWQGVDVPGRTNRLVLIDRIPFPRPDDPLAAARSEAISRKGGNGFMAVSAHHAGLLLAQGAGRLIRSVDDRGVVAILDSRLATKRYGGYLQATLPPLWPTTDPAVVQAALQRLQGN